MISQSDNFMYVGPEYAARVIARQSHPCPAASLLPIPSLVSRLALHRFLHAAKTAKKFSEKVIFLRKAFFTVFVLEPIFTEPHPTETPSQISPISTEILWGVYGCSRFSS